ncbi:MAG: YjhX family toxin [Hyphomicrobiaceae bacterium]|nr:YjhX family toxin [Hyphomicrobiaceae bacterium]
MNISKYEQRVLHVLAQGGAIHFSREGSRVVDVTCYTRDGYVLSDCTHALFQKLKKRGFIVSTQGAPYRISRAGRDAVRSQADNR